MIFGGKGGKQAIAKSMKEKFKLVKRPRGYVISSICDPAVKVATQILVGKVMKKCHANEVTMPIVTLTVQCTEGV